MEAARRLLDDQLSDAIRQVESSVTASHEVATQAGKAAVDGTQDVAATLTGMKAISRSTQQAVQRMAEMGDRSREIGGIVESISDIAERTNLLALNAAIEAARAENTAGRRGCRRSTRRLAGQASHATQEISDLVGRTGDDTASDQRHDQSNSEVEQGMHLAERTQHGLDRIQQSVSQVVADRLC
ncbi:MAG: methyl-accepting chemotaxis protein [Caldilineaceae bacterium]